MGTSARVTILEGRARGASFQLGQKHLHELGSGPTVDIPIDGDPAVAAVHLKIHQDQGEFTAFDVSGRGFLHRGNRAIKVRLETGDVIQLGATKLRFDLDAPPPTGPRTQAGALTDRRPVNWIDETNPAGEEAPPANPTTTVLHALRGHDVGKTYDLGEKESFVLGRGVATDIPVFDIRASRLHCRIDKDEDGFLLTDLNSSNGTYVNGRKITTQRLGLGDEVRIGSTVLKLEAR